MRPRRYTETRVRVSEEAPGTRGVGVRTRPGSEKLDVGRDGDPAVSEGVAAAGPRHVKRELHGEHIGAAAGRRGGADVGAIVRVHAEDQGLTLVHFSAQLEPCARVCHQKTPCTPYDPKHPLTTLELGIHTPYAHPLLSQNIIQSAQVEMKSGRV